MLARIGGGTLWIAALTAALLPIERLVGPDRADGFPINGTFGNSELAIAAAKMRRALADIRTVTAARRRAGTRAGWARRHSAGAHGGRLAIGTRARRPAWRSPR